MKIINIKNEITGLLAAKKQSEVKEKISTLAKFFIAFTVHNKDLSRQLAASIENIESIASEGKIGNDLELEKKKHHQMLGFIENFGKISRELNSFALSLKHEHGLYSVKHFWTDSKNLRIISLLREAQKDIEGETAVLEEILSLISDVKKQAQGLISIDIHEKDLVRREKSFLEKIVPKGILGIFRR